MPLVEDDYWENGAGYVFRCEVCGSSPIEVLRLFDSRSNIFRVFCEGCLPSAGRRTNIIQPCHTECAEQGCTNEVYFAVEESRELYYCYSCNRDRMRRLRANISSRDIRDVGDILRIDTPLPPWSFVRRTYSYDAEDYLTDEPDPEPCNCDDCRGIRIPLLNITFSMLDVNQEKKSYLFKKIIKPLRITT